MYFSLHTRRNAGHCGVSLHELCVYMWLNIACVGTSFYSSLALLTSICASIVQTINISTTLHATIFCTALFSLRWWVYWYKSFSVFEHIAKMTKFWWNFKSTIQIRGFSPILVISWNIRMCSWNDTINFTESCSVVELFISKNPALWGGVDHLNCISCRYCLSWWVFEVCSCYCFV